MSPKGWFDSTSMTEGRGEGSVVKFHVICPQGNNLAVTQRETNGPAGQAGKVSAESDTGAIKAVAI